MEHSKLQKRIGRSTGYQSNTMMMGMVDLLIFSVNEFFTLNVQYSCNLRTRAGLLHSTFRYTCTANMYRVCI